MLQVTVDVFSGRPNPVWVLDDGAETRTILDKLAKARSSLADPAAGPQGLGFRGVRVEFTDDEGPARHDLPTSFLVGAGAAAGDAAKGTELAEQLVKTALRTPKEARLNVTAEAFDAELERYILGLLATPAGATDGFNTTADAVGGPAGDAAAAAFSCGIELGKFNPGFWNDPAHVRLNNCYNYGTNRRTDTFAQPGRASGHMYAALTCAAVSPAAVSDGAHRRGVCCPDSEKPRWFMALVVAPGADYHWYRKQAEGFWGHKPGSTPARNTDNQGHVITNPETCDRGPYKDFCGYFYAPKSMKVR